METHLNSAPCNWIHEVLWVEIFKRLPIKTLGRFRCVCNSWNSLISSPLFITQYHSFAISSSTTPPKLTPYLLHYPNPRSYTICRPQEHTLLTHILHFPFPYPPSVFDPSLTLVDVVNGVLCVSYSKYSSLDSAILWNPAIRKYVALPRLSSLSSLDSGMAWYCCNVVGFGYDSSRNVFKVVRICIPSREIRLLCSPVSPTCEVYSGQEGRWRAVVAENIKLCEFEFDGSRTRGTGYFVNGTIHWIVRAPGGKPELEKYLVLMFDCEREEFGVMDLLLEMFHSVDAALLRIELLEHGGMLAVLVSLDMRNTGSRIEMWVMEEYGVASSWRKLYKIDHHIEESSFVVYRPSFEELVPYGPNQWSKYRNSPDLFGWILCGHVYEESLFLMDDTNARSYTKEETVSI